MRVLGAVGGNCVHHLLLDIGESVVETTVNLAVYLICLILLLQRG
jgi:hypothetical protein